MEHLDHKKRYFSLKRSLAVLFALLTLAAISFTAWAYTPLGPMPQAMAALQSDEQVLVETWQWITFRPSTGQPLAGFILYPGGRVDARSYASTAHAIAARGYLVVIARMPLNLAVFGANRADAIIAAYPQIGRWAIGGHSLGGAMAASYVYRHPQAVQGLILWASYPAANNSLANQAIRVVSIYGTEDGLATVDKIEASRLLLPPDTRWVAIQGGNHAQFGWYGLQPGDGEPGISREAQQDQIIEAVIDFLPELL